MCATRGDRQAPAPQLHRRKQRKYRGASVSTLAYLRGIPWHSVFLPSAVMAMRSGQVAKSVLANAKCCLPKPFGTLRRLGRSCCLSSLNLVEAPDESMISGSTKTVRVSVPFTRPGRATHQSDEPARYESADEASIDGRLMCGLIDGWSPD